MDPTKPSVLTPRSQSCPCSINCVQNSEGRLVAFHTTSAISASSAVEIPPRRANCGYYLASRCSARQIVAITWRHAARRGAPWLQTSGTLLSVADRGYKLVSRCSTRQIVVINWCPAARRGESLLRTGERMRRKASGGFNTTPVSFLGRRFGFEQSFRLRGEASCGSDKPSGRSEGSGGSDIPRGRPRSFACVRSYGRALEPPRARLSSRATVQSETA